MTNTDSSFLEHKERTLQDLFDEATPEQKDLRAIIVAAAIDDVDISGATELVEGFDALPNEQKDLIDFVVGASLAEDISVQHSDDLKVGAFLEHFGVKGMKWGVRKQDPSSPSLAKRTSGVQIDAARARVNSGTGSLADAHKAALKTAGHRVFNAVLGDKTYWKRTAIATGVAATVAAAAVAAPAVLPASTLAAVGAWAGGTTAFGGAATFSSSTLAAAGASAITGMGTTAAYAGWQVANAVNGIGNLARAAGGNMRISRNYEKLGREIHNRQTAGNKQTRKILNKSGSIPKARLKQSDLKVGSFLEHYSEIKLEDLNGAF